MISPTIEKIIKLDRFALIRCHERAKLEGMLLDNQLVIAENNYKRINGNNWLDHRNVEDAAKLLIFENKIMMQEMGIRE